MKRLLIGLDIGTSSVKAGLYDTSGGELAVKAKPISTQSPYPGWAEQDPGEWWAAVKTVLGQIARLAGSDELVAIGLSAQCPGHVLVDDQGEPLGSAIIWRDQRAKQEADWLNAHLSSEQAIQWTGHEVLADATQPAARILWLKKNRIQDWRKMRYILQPKDFIGYKLTGRCVTDFHTAYSLTAQSIRSYSEGFVNFLGLELKNLPELEAPEYCLGSLEDEIASEVGISGCPKVINGTIDAYCENLAGGAIIPGNAVDVAGTSEIISLGTTRSEEGSGVFLGKLGGHAFLCGPTQAGGETLHWLNRTFYGECAGRIDYGLLEKEAEAVSAGSNRLIFLPYLQGERAPIWDSNASGVFMGLTLAHDRRHLSRAVFEGIGFAIRHILETCEEVCGEKANRVIVSGGGSRSNFWNHVKADILQKRVIPIKAEASACLGAAMLAAFGIGEQGSLEDAHGRMSRQADPVEPDPSTQSIYDENYEVYRRIYPSMQPLFQVFQQESAHA